jgi:hypothetical protein
MDYVSKVKCLQLKNIEKKKMEAKGIPLPKFQTPLKSKGYQFDRYHE